MWDLGLSLSAIGIIFEGVGLIWYFSKRKSIDEEIHDYIYGTSCSTMEERTDRLRKKYEAQTITQVLIGIGIILQFFGILYQV